MKVFLLVLLIVSAVLSQKNDKTSARRSPRLFGDWFSGVLPRCTGCPFRSCVRDSSVIHGYCCGCARVSDFLPIDCPGIHVRCPTDGRRLCRDYDYMLDCCC